jgi:meso-butanediol dehydrogenase / (S,S)-butanediol dehydrogenase / diacetyl reductase
MRLADKVCVVTGGGSGIGRATSLLFAREGAKVVIADTDLSAAEEVAAEAREGDARSTAVAVDVSSSVSVREMVRRTIDEFDRLDVLVNNAGYGFAATVVQTEEADWDRLMAVNLKGVYLGCKYAIPVMSRQGGGVIVNTASVGATVGIKERAAYCASKGGVASLTKVMAVDHAGENIRVNCVAPGTIDTPYHADIEAASGDAAAFREGLEARQVMNRLGRAEEIARAILYLACDESSFATGSMLTVDGGMTAW